MKQNKGRPPVATGKHKLRAGGDQATAIADAGTYLTMPIFMGENMESNTVMVDTGSNRLNFDFRIIHVYYRMWWNNLRLFRTGWIHSWGGLNFELSLNDPCWVCCYRYYLCY